MYLHKYLETTVHKNRIRKYWYLKITECQLLIVRNIRLPHNVFVMHLCRSFVYEKNYIP